MILGKVYRGYSICSVNTLPNLTRVFGTAGIPYRTSLECSVPPRYHTDIQYPTEHSGKVWYDLDAGTVHFGRGIIPNTASIYPAEVVRFDRSILSNSVRPQYPTDLDRSFRYDLNIGTRKSGKFGTSSKYTPDTSIPYRTYPCKDLEPSRPLFRSYKRGTRSNTASLI